MSNRKPPSITASDSLFTRLKNSLLVADGDRWAWLLWAAFAALVVVVKFDVAPSPGNVFNIYRETGFRWREGLDLYPAELYFNYFPSAALFFVPWTWLPFDIGGAIWRAANIGIFALGLWRFTSVTELPGLASLARSAFLVASLFTIALCWSAARYGQITLMMAGLMMMAVADVQRGGVWRAAIFASVAVALKPHAMALLLVLSAIYPRLLWRALIVCAVLTLLPFLFQDPRYVFDQYAFIPEMLQTRSERTDRIFAHIFDLLGSISLVTSNLQQALVRLISAIFVLFLCWRTVKRKPSPGVAFYLYAFTSCYILLLGAGIEPNTYAMMGPIIGLLAVCTWTAGRRSYFVTLCVMTAATLLSHTLSKAFPSHTVMGMTKPLVCLILLVLVWRLAWKTGLTADGNIGGIRSHTQSLS